jgi:RHS repeat-associated protein
VNTIVSVSKSGVGVVASGSTASASISFSALTPAAYTVTSLPNNISCFSPQASQANFTIDATPSVSLSASASQVGYQGSVTLTASASDSVSSISKINLYDGSTLMGSSPSSSYVFTDSSMSSGNHSFTAQAVDSYGYTATSSAVSVSVASPTVPGPPTSVSATAGNAAAIVSFGAPSSNGGAAITTYTATSSPGGLSASGAGSPLVVAGLTDGTAYTFTVTAANSVGTGPASAASNSVTPATVPTAPTSVSATAGNAAATITFGAPASNGGAAIATYTATSSPGGLTASGAGSPLVVTGLTDGTAYTFTVTAANSAGTGPASAASNSVIPATVPSAPTSVSAFGGNTTATVSFGSPSSNGGAAITNYTATSSPGGFTASGAASPLVVTGLTNGTAYTFTVTAANSVGTGPASAASNSVTPANLTVPGAPTTVSATGGNATATVSFGPPGSNGGAAITSYTATSNPGGLIASGPASPLVVAGLTDGTAYTFTVTATNSVGTGPASAASKSVTPATVPSAPTSVSASGGNAVATVSFAAPANNGGAAITGYTASSSPGGLTASGPGSPLVVAGLTNGTAYTFTVTATNSAGTGPASAASNAVTPTSVTVPGAPTPVSATASNSTATVSFGPPGTNGGAAITSYTATSNPGGLIASGPASPLVVGGLTNGTAYTFTVTATNSAGTGPASAASNSVIPGTVPGAPTSVSAAGGNLIATVSFGPPTSNGGVAITKYTVTSSPGGSVGTGVGSPITVTGLADGTTYTFTVTATNAVGTGPASAPSNSVTPEAGLMVPGAPTIGTASPGNGSATVAFTAPANDGNSAITSYTATSNPSGLTGTGVPANEPGALLHFDTTGGDVLGHNFGFVYGASISTTYYKVGNGSLSLNGSLQLLYTASSPDFDLQGDFTIEAWVSYNTVSTSVPQALIGRDNGAGSQNKWCLGLNILSPGYFSLHRNSPTGVQHNLNWPWSPSANTWYHLAMVRSGNNWTVYVNGASLGTIVDANPMPLTTAQLTIGALGEAIWYMNGYIDEMRIASGTAVYLSNFMPPTGQLSPVKGNSGSIFVSGLTAGTAYTFTVTATNAEGTGPASAPSNSVASLLQPVTAVGRTPGNFAVSATGAATYTIPLWTPPGARGIEPHLQLSYNSRGSDGLVGPGWSLDGVSYITRCNRTYAQGGPSAVTLTASDSFCLDGNRLLSGSGTYGADQSAYGTEIADFSKIVLHNTAGNMTGSWFEVHRKDGLIYEYGNTTDSRVVAAGTSLPIMWGVNKIRDRQGNNLIVTYSQNLGSDVPVTIQYTQTPATSAAYNYKVTFTWGERAAGDSIVGYVGGTKVTQSNLLSAVDVAYQGTTVRHYTMLYSVAPTTARARLTGVQECAGLSSSDCLAPTQIGYQDSVGGIASPTTPVGGGANVSGSNLAYFLDMNGDGRQDLINGILSGSTYHWYVQFATANGFGPMVDTGILTSSTQPVLFDDFLAEGKNGILAANGASYWYYRWNGASFVGANTGLPATEQYAGFNSMVSADVDGDGRPDVMFLGTDLHLYVRVNGGGSNAPIFGTTRYDVLGGIPLPVPGRLFGNNSFPWSPVHRMDFDGDGRDDVLFEYFAPRQTYHVVQFLSRGTAGVAGNYNFAPAEVQAMAPVNWNNDACTDLVLYSSIVVSDCNGAVGGTIDASGVLATAGAGWVFAMDWDGDGRTDLVGESSSTGQLYVFKSTGDGIAPGVAVMQAPGGLEPRNFVSQGSFFVFDQNGDGLDDVAFANAAASGTFTYGLHNGANTPPDLATSFTDAFGVNQSPSYTSIVQGKYTNASAAYPEKEYLGPVFVVGDFSASDGVGGAYTETFTYRDSRVNVQGRGYEGFGGKTMTDSRDGLIRSDLFAQAFPFTGLPLTHSVLEADGATPISVVSTTPSELTAATAPGTLFPYLSQVIDAEYEVSSGALYGKPIQQTVTSYTFDTYGNLTNRSTSVTDEDTTSPNHGRTWGKGFSQAITPDATDWCVSAPTQILDSRTEPSGASITRTTHALWDYVNCRVTQRVEEPSSATLQTTTNYGYDGCGNVDSVQVLGQNPDGTAMPARATTYNYAAATTNCQAPETVQNVLGQTTTIGYRYDLGQLASVTDSNGITVASWGYDHFARRNLLTRPDGTQSTWTYTACEAPSYCGVGDPTLQYDLRQSELDATSAHAAYWARDKLFDQFDRLRYDDPEQSNGAQTQTALAYDALGRLHTQSNPSGNGFATYYTTSLYDLRNRPTSVCRPVSSTNSSTQCTYFGYAGQTRTVQDARGNTKTRLLDVLGEVVQLTDPDGVSKTLYAYDPFQNPTLVQDPGGAQIVRSYDIRGHLLTSNDPDRGAWTFESDSLGELVHERDAKTASPIWTRQFSYDLLGRMATRTEAEGVTTWTWGTRAAAHEIGRLAELSGLGETESYSYDPIGRLSNRTTTWGGNSYAIDYAYNTQGQLDTLIYPATSLSANRFQVKYGYTGRYLTSLQNYTGNVPGTVFWELTPGGVNMDPWGNVVDETLGSSPASRIQSYFDPVTDLLSTREVGTGGAANNVQSQAFQWDQNRNLSERQDLIQGLTEVFNYDSLNRLSYSTLNGVENLVLSFDSTGNILSRIEGGSTYAYVYDPVHKHAVTSMGTAVLSYDANGNLATRNSYSLAWTSYNLPTSIPRLSGTSTFAYGPKRDRIQQISTYTANGDSGGTETTVSIDGIFEVFTEPTQTHYKHYLQVPSGTQIVYDLQSVSGAQTSYVATDHLGSSSVLLNSSYGAPLQMSFSAYGYRRASNWSGPLSATAADYAEIVKTTRRGYMSQEMLDNIDLVHLNGRVFDPVIGRFLSPDPIISGIDDSQELNPYSYVANRPLSMVDPSGLDGCPPFAVCVTGSLGGDDSGPAPDSPGFAFPNSSPGGHYGGFYPPTRRPPNPTPYLPSGIGVGPVRTAAQTELGLVMPLWQIIQEALQFDPATDYLGPEQIVVRDHPDHSSDTNSTGPFVDPANGSPGSPGPSNRPPAPQGKQTQNTSACRSGSILQDAADFLTQHGYGSLSINLTALARPWALGPSVNFTFTVSNQGITAYVGGGIGQGSSVSLTGGLSEGSSSGWGERITGSLAPGAGPAVTGAWYITQGGSSMNVASGIGVNSSANVTFGYKGTLISFGQPDSCGH